VVQATHLRTISIVVNTKPVDLMKEPGKPEATGAEIKAAAIAQGVNIRADFPLFEVHGNRLKPIGDNETIGIHPNQQFRAVTPDDNS